MGAKVWIAAKTINCLNAGGNFWVYLNWALGLRSLGCDVTWLETVNPNTPPATLQNLLHHLKIRLKEYGFQSISLCPWNDDPLSPAATAGCINVESSAGADLLVNMVYGIPSTVVSRFRRAVLIDIDPGLTQIWVSKGQIHLAPHDIYFTIGETVGRTEAPIPNCGLEWRYTPPCIALDWWPVHAASEKSSFSTVSHWHMDEWIEDENGWYKNDKRSGFLPFIDLPRRTNHSLELALCMKDGEDDWKTMLKRGWKVRNALKIASTPQDYQHYIQKSRGEFSCAKPSCIRLRNAWISDRTLCYLASGKPAVVQHTGPSQFLPECEGLFRFRDMAEATQYLDIAESDYDQQCRFARRLVEQHFDARKVVKKLLQDAID
jgi:hypothetical protein